MTRESMDTAEVVRHLNRALAAQLRGVVLYLAGSATLPSFELAGSAEWLFESAREELADARLVMQKIVALGGEPTLEAGSTSWAADPREAAPALIEAEREALEALAGVIPPTGTEPRSEAVEHLVEHLIMRKQHRLDLLERRAQIRERP